MPCTVYNQESQFLRVGSGTATTYSSSNTKFSVKYFNLKINKNIFNSKLFLQWCKKIQIRQKNWGKFQSDNRFLNLKILNYFNKIWNYYFSTYSKVLLKQQSLNQIRHSSLGHNRKSDIISYQKILNYFNELWNGNFSVLWLKWNQAMVVKQNQTFFHGTYSNLTPYLSLTKNIKIFQWLLKSKFLSFTTKVKANNGNETKSDIFPWDIFKFDTISFLSQRY